MVLTSGNLAGVNLLAWFIFIRRRKVFHRMERELGLKVICTRGKWQSYSGYRDDPSSGHFQAHTGLPAQGRAFSVRAIPPRHPSTSHFLLFCWDKGKRDE